MAVLNIDPDYGFDAPEIATPAAPSSGRRRLYPRTDGWYDQDDTAEVKLSDANHNHDTNGVRTLHSTADVSNPPTDAELDAEFGTPATVGAGFIATIDDNGADANFYMVWSTGASWVIHTGTKAV